MDDLNEFQPGDWAAPAEPRNHGQYFDGLPAARVTRVVAHGHSVLSSVYMEGVSQSFSNDNLRPATPEEIASVPIKKGDLITGASGKFPFLAASSHGVGGDCAACTGHGVCACRHASPEAWRQANGVDEPLEESSVERLALDPEKVEAQFGEHEKRMAKIEKSHHWDYGLYTGLCEGAHSRDARIDALDARLSEEECDGSHNTAALPLLERRVATLEAAPAKPPEPELPPLLWDRLTGQGPYIWAIAPEENDTRAFYYSGVRVAHKDGTGDAVHQAAVVMLYPQTLTTKRPVTAPKGTWRTAACWAMLGAAAPLAGILLAAL